MLPARTGSSARRRHRSSQAISESADFLIEFGASAIKPSKSTYICREEGEIKENNQRDSPDNWLVGDLKCNNWQDEVQVAVWLFRKLKAIQVCKKMKVYATARVPAALQILLWTCCPLSALFSKDLEGCGALEPAESGEKSLSAAHRSQARVNI